MTSNQVVGAEALRGHHVESMRSQPQPATSSLIVTEWRVQRRAFFDARNAQLCGRVELPCIMIFRLPYVTILHSVGVLTQATRSVVAMTDIDFFSFLPRDALWCKEWYCYCMSSVTLVDQDHIGWQSWKLTARTISPTSSLL